MENLDELKTEIRSKINELDTVAGNLIELIEELNENSFEGDYYDFLTTLEHLQFDITEEQENQGWI